MFYLDTDPIVSRETWEIPTGNSEVDIFVSLSLIRCYQTIQYMPSSKSLSPDYEPQASIMSITWDFLRDSLSATLVLEVNSIPLEVHT